MFDEDKEPTDIFAGIDPVSKTASADTATQPDSASSSRNRVVRSGPPRWLFALIALAVLGALGGGGYYFFVLRDAGTETPVAPSTMDETPQIPIEPTEPVDVLADPLDATLPEVDPNDGLDEPMVDPNLDEIIEPTSENPSEQPATQSPPLPTVPETASPVTDSDGDGLSDEMEAMLATDIVNPDTDGDGLTDGEEVNIYKTDPLKPDTDGDSYLDGAEVKGGYNPNGEGRLLGLPPTP